MMHEERSRCWKGQPDRRGSRILVAEGEDEIESPVLESLVQQPGKYIKILWFGMYILSKISYDKGIKLDSDKHGQGSERSLSCPLTN